MNKLVALLLSFCLAVCAGLSSAAESLVLVENGALAAPPGYGIAIVSLTVVSQDPDNTIANLLLEGPQGTQKLTVRNRTDQIASTGRQASLAGEVFVLALPAGDYRFSEIKGEWRIYSKVSGGVRYFNLPINQAFSIAPQAVIYLGSVDLDVSIRTDWRWSQPFKRDMNDVASRFAVTDFSNVKTQ